MEEQRRQDGSPESNPNPIRMAVDEMLESPAYRALSLSGHRIWARIQIEHAHHGGKENGKLPVTYRDFNEFGVCWDAIGRVSAKSRPLASYGSPMRGVRAMGNGGSRISSH
jgi:hypothetical protein